MKNLILNLKKNLKRQKKQELINFFYLIFLVVPIFLIIFLFNPFNHQKSSKIELTIQLNEEEKGNKYSLANDWGKELIRRVKAFNNVISDFQVNYLTSMDKKEINLKFEVNEKLLLNKDNNEEFNFRDQLFFNIIRTGHIFFLDDKGNDLFTSKIKIEENKGNNSGDTSDISIRDKRIVQSDFFESLSVKSNPISNHSEIIFNINNFKDKKNEEKEKINQEFFNELNSFSTQKTNNKIYVISDFPQALAYARNSFELLKKLIDIIDKNLSKANNLKEILSMETIDNRDNIYDLYKDNHTRVEELIKNNQVNWIWKEGLGFKKSSDKLININVENKDLKYSSDGNYDTKNPDWTPAIYWLPNFKDLFFLNKEKEIWDYHFWNYIVGVNPTFINNQISLNSKFDFKEPFDKKNLVLNENIDLTKSVNFFLKNHKNNKTPFFYLTNFQKEEKDNFFLFLVSLIVLTFLISFILFKTYRLYSFSLIIFYLFNFLTAFSIFFFFLNFFNIYTLAALFVWSFIFYSLTFFFRKLLTNDLLNDLFINRSLFNLGNKLFFKVIKPLLFLFVLTIFAFWFSTFNIKNFFLMLNFLLFFTLIGCLFFYFWFWSKLKLGWNFKEAIINNFSLNSFFLKEELLENKNYKISKGFQKFSSRKYFCNRSLLITFSVLGSFIFFGSNLKPNLSKEFDSKISFSVYNIKTVDKNEKEADFIKEEIKNQFSSIKKDILNWELVKNVNSKDFTLFVNTYFFDENSDKFLNFKNNFKEKFDKLNQDNRLSWETLEQKNNQALTGKLFLSNFIYLSFFVILGLIFIILISNISFLIPVFLFLIFNFSVFINTLIVFRIPLGLNLIIFSFINLLILLTSIFFLIPLLKRNQKFLSIKSNNFLKLNKIYFNFFYLFATYFFFFFPFSFLVFIFTNNFFFLVTFFISFIINFLSFLFIISLWIFLNKYSFYFKNKRKNFIYKKIQIQEEHIIEGINE
jgi:hypothetical protein